MQMICTCNNNTFRSKMQYMQRKSINREKIIDLFNKEHLLSAHACHKKLKDMDLATIYRNIKQLLKANVIKEVHINNSEQFYELNINSHQHLVCNNCGKIESIEIPETLIPNMLKSSTFKIENVQLNIIGKCKDCK